MTWVLSPADLLEEWRERAAILEESERLPPGARDKKAWKLMVEKHGGGAMTRARFEAWREGGDTT
jgi:hypothetical protein